MTPRSPSALAAPSAMTAVTRRSMLKLPSRLIRSVRSKLASACVPLRPCTFSHDCLYQTQYVDTVQQIDPQRPLEPGEGVRPIAARHLLASCNACGIDQAVQGAQVDEGRIHGVVGLLLLGNVGHIASGLG